MRVFLSHCSKDKPKVEVLATALRERGLDVWLDMWEMQAGADLAGRINQALDESDAGLIVFSHAAAESRWVPAETSYLIWAHVEEAKLLVPVTIEDDAPIPALVRPLLRKGIEEVDAIADALRSRRAGKPPLGSAPAARVEKVTITLRRAAEGLSIETRLRDTVLASSVLGDLPAAVLKGEAQFRRELAGARRDRATAERSAREQELVLLGRALAELCLPEDAGEAVADLLAGSKVGTQVEICFESEDPRLLGLPFETLRLEDGQLLSTHRKVVMLRRPLGVRTDVEPLPGPLKVLVAVGAPDEGHTGSVVLDQERELQNILDATSRAEGLGNVQVRILEVGSPKEIGKALEADPYHVLHLSCHGLPGLLELENEDGEALQATAAELLAPLHGQRHRLPMVFLNSCHGAVREGETASLAEELLREGVGSVLAMQRSVTDHYAIELAGRFYGHLATSEKDVTSASRALAWRGASSRRSGSRHWPRARRRPSPCNRRRRRRRSSWLGKSTR